MIFRDAIFQNSTDVFTAIFFLFWSAHRTPIRRLLNLPRMNQSSSEQIYHASEHILRESKCALLVF